VSDFVFKQLINGQWQDASNGKTWNLLNPATEESLGLMPFGNGDDAQAAIDAAAAALPAWSHKTAYERADVLMKAAAWIRARVNDLAAISTEECGKPLRESSAEWQTGANLFEWYAEEGKRVYGRTIPSRKADRRIMVVYQAVGVVGTITAWNFPIYNIARAWAAALAAGCTIVGRPSEYTPRSGMLLAQSLHEAGAPAGVINVINGEPEAMGQAMLNDPRCRKISFTGSTRVGKILSDGASRTMTKLALELGGNAPVIVFPDVNVEQVAKQAVSFKNRNAGQVCIAPQRFLVHSRIAEEFIEHAAEFSRKLHLGSGLESTTDVGPMINAVQRQRVETMVAEAVQQGAQVLTGGSRPADMPKGYFFSPTVVTNLTTDMRLYNEEIFGPVMPIVPFGDVDEALALANNTEYGLAAYVQTSNLNTAIRMYEELEYGMIAINDWLPSTPEAPFGGMKQSGIGRECGQEGLEKYLEPKTVYFGGVSP
jgi:acyl-CoA reductase-like NAD-dependent aldehyde dehydrogenase